MRGILLALVAISALTAAQNTVRIQVQAGPAEKIIELPLERYVSAVLGGESSVFQSREALKAMAVAARTYAVRMRGRHEAEGFDLCSTTHCQRLDLVAVTPRLERAAADTVGELLWYHGKPAFTPYTRDCGGRTEDAASVWPDLATPYLKSHADPYCARLGTSHWRWTADPKQITEALARSSLHAPRSLDRIAILDRTSSGRAAMLVLTGGSESIRISATSFRFAVGRELGWDTIRGDQYEIHVANGRMVFEGNGSGHGVGLCQDGAEQMGLGGSSYREILAFYYPGTAVGLTGRGLAWQRLSGEILSLQTTQPDQDRPVLQTAEHLARMVAQRTGWLFPIGTELRVYPDLDTFRDATGEPGWVAAHTQNRTIDLQPVSMLRSKGVLESTLTHELLHVLIEGQAAPGLPVWFREGIVSFLEGAQGGNNSARPPVDRDLRQTTDAIEARRAYADADAAVRRLVRTYGEASVLDWVKRGLPPDVTKASSNPAPAKSR
jgi:stage II sporulation protein D